MSVGVYPLYTGRKPFVEFVTQQTCLLDEVCIHSLSHAHEKGLDVGVSFCSHQ